MNQKLEITSNIPFCHFFLNSYTILVKVFACYNLFISCFYNRFQFSFKFAKLIPIFIPVHHEKKPSTTVDIIGHAILNKESRIRRKNQPTKSQQ